MLIKFEVEHLPKDQNFCVLKLPVFICT